MSVLACTEDDKGAQFGYIESMKFRARSILTAVALALLLAGCDRCGDLVKGEGGKAPLACKGDGPQPQ